MREDSVINEILGDFGVKMPRVLISGNHAVVDSVKKIYVLSCDVVTLETPEGYISILGDDICVETLCDERIELCGSFRGVEIIRQEGKKLRQDRGETGKQKDTSLPGRETAGSGRVKRLEK